MFKKPDSGPAQILVSGPETMISSGVANPNPDHVGQPVPGHPIKLLVLNQYIF